MAPRHSGAGAGGAEGFAGLLVVDLHVPQSRSLKDKRSPVRSVTQSLKNAGFSASEVDHHDRLQVAQLAISIVARRASDVERLLDEAVRICERPEAEVVTRQRTVLSLRDVAD